MDKPMPSFAFRLMSLGFKFRDLFLDPIDILKEAFLKILNTLLLLYQSIKNQEISL